MKKSLHGIVHNISTNPFQTFSKKRSNNSTFLSFDINFDLVDEHGDAHHVWFQRSFRFPPPLEDGDHIDLVGRDGHFLGLIGRNNFYAIRIIDKDRGKEYTPWRNKGLKNGPGSGRPADTRASNELSA
jgi:hypothetical protein